jgi:hypothetical protein
MQKKDSIVLFCFAEYALRSWPETTQGSAVVQLMWSKSRPSLFFVLDAKSNLYIW